MEDTFRLTVEEQQRLRAQDRPIQTVRETLDKMARIGLPVDEQKERLERAIQVRDGLIREFGNPVMPR